MVYDPEKYRDKREKVLGIKKRGFSFGAVAVFAVLTIVAGITLVVVPGTLSYMKTRNLDDAIFKLSESKTWEKNVADEIRQIKGVDEVLADKEGTRVVVTFDRRMSSVSKFMEIFEKNNLEATLLNRVNHRQRQIVLEQEKET